MTNTKPYDTLVIVGENYEGVQTFTSGNANELMMDMAQEHAAHMAAIHRQGHQGWSGRFREIVDSLGVTPYEVCAETWDRQADDYLHEVAEEMYRCWKQSPGHWATISVPCTCYGAGMAKSSRGVWYACIICDAKKEKHHG